MRKAVMTAIFPAELETVWEIVTNNEQTAWRSDLDRVELLDGGSAFVEYTKSGMSTTFHITKREPCKEYAFTLENDMIEGVWTGTFSAVSGGTKIVFTEQVRTKKRVLGFLAYFMPLRAMQRQYADDLRRALETKKQEA